jgi:Coenzyme PQQ synthesis protein D (PqqD)
MPGRRAATAAAARDSIRPRADAAVLYREARTGCILYHPGTNEAHVLNLTAAYIWTCCDGATGVANIAVDLASTCGIPLRQARTEVAKTLRRFRAKNLIG